ncbi:phage tail tube protein [Amycolatopsis taiwanensis]|uniref:phage tail tube protein n=1 Tax=Amycolatopsis taiwanensis TaxID=342230 RepID=UPI0004B7C90A|nr:IPT/TIG domain-containing protein [Amycolatopsis taiwanensis]
MAVPTRTPLGASTTAGMYYLDVDIASNQAAPNWIAVMGLNNFQPKFDPTLQDDSDFDSEGWGSSTKTFEKWSAEFKVGRKSTASDVTSYDPGQEFLRTHSTGKIGNSARVHLRWYEMTEGGPRVEAYEGWATVGWSPDGGKVDDLNIVSVTLTGQGKLLSIEHPDTGSAAPIVSGLSPAGGPAEGGTLVRVTGSGFTGVTGATGVKVGGTSATAYDVVSDGIIAVVVPAHAAGQVDVTITSAAGTSAASAATKYTYS